MLINTVKRAKYLVSKGEELFASPALTFFLNRHCSVEDIRCNSEALEHFCNLDDSDIWTSLKVWQSHSDKVLSLLSAGMVNRRLYKIEITNEPHTSEKKQQYLSQFMEKYVISEEEANYFVSTDSLATDMYNQYDESIKILFKDGSIKDISNASDMFNIELLSKKMEKYYFAYLRD